MRKGAKILLTFFVGLVIGTLTAYGYYYHDPYEGIPCSDCPKAFNSRPNPREECKACCTARCERESERNNCFTQCDRLPQP